MIAFKNSVFAAVDLINGLGRGVVDFCVPGRLGNVHAVHMNQLYQFEPAGIVN